MKMTHLTEFVEMLIRIKDERNAHEIHLLQTTCESGLSHRQVFSSGRAIGLKEFGLTSGCLGDMVLA